MRAKRPSLARFDAGGLCVARLSRKAGSAWTNRLDSVVEVRLVALVHRASDQDPSRRGRCLASQWEIPITEIALREDRRDPREARTDWRCSEFDPG